MTRRGLVNLVLLGVVAVLGGLVYLLPARGPAPSPPPLTGLTPGQVSRVQIGRAGGTAIVMVRRDKRWRMIKPVRVAANRFLVHSLLGITQADSYGRFAAGGRDLGQFGLAAPSLRLRLNDLEIAFGGNEPLNGRRYVRIGDTVHVISNLYYQEASGGPAAFVSRALLPEDSAPVRLVFPDKVLERDEQGRWVLAAGGHRRTAPGAGGLVDRWRRAQALGVKPYVGKGDHPAVTVSFGKDRHDLEFEIVSKDPELILARPDIGMAYHFPASQAERLLRLPKAGRGGGGSPQS